jgi:V/A-type H+-transporting ATPase subunit E
MKNQENLEGIILKLKEQGIQAGETEKSTILEAANEKANKIIADANAKSKEIIDKANVEAAQIEKNSKAAISQAARDFTEGTKIAIIKHLQSTFEKQCETLLNQEEYLKELLKIVVEMIPGNKTVMVSPELVQKMESFIVKTAFAKDTEIKPLDKSEAKISVTCTNNKEIQFVLTSKDIQDGLFSLLNKELVERISNSREG